MGGKKFGTNSKADEARAKKAEVKKSENDRKAKEKEDAMWEEKDEKVISKLKKKQEMEEKKQQEAKRKAENKKLAEAEDNEMKKFGKGKDKEVHKVTRYDIDQQKERDQRDREKQRVAAAAGTTTTTTTTSSSKQDNEDSDDDFDLQENINHILREQRMKEGGDYLEAREVGDAIKMLQTSNQDEHPERRMKAAYAAYETEHLSQLRKENPSLRFTQVKQLLWQQWLKADENPFNQVKK